MELLFVKRQNKMKKLITLILFLVSFNIYAESVTLSWAAPTENTNGSALTDLTSYIIKYGNSENTMTNEVIISDPTIIRYSMDIFNTTYFTIYAINSTNISSTSSNIAVKNIILVPNAPILTIESGAAF